MSSADWVIMRRIDMQDCVASGAPGSYGTSLVDLNTAFSTSPALHLQEANFMRRHSDPPISQRNDEHNEYTV
jgi:hypothetical protein